MKKVIAMLLALLLFAIPAAALVEDEEVEYLGGTATGVKEGTIGKFDTTDVHKLIFDYKGGKLQIPYAQITHYEYTRKLARHLGVVPTIAIVLVLKHLQRRHFVVIDYKDEEGIAQSAVFEVSKDIPQTLEAVMHVRAPKASMQSWQANDPCNTGGLITESCPRTTTPPPCAVNQPCTRQPQPSSQAISGAASQTPAAGESQPASSDPDLESQLSGPDAASRFAVPARTPANAASPANARGAGKMDAYPTLRTRHPQQQDDDVPVVSLEKGGSR